MADKTRISWTNATWNPVTGCEKVSAGCKHCYALRDWARLSSNPKTVYFGRKFTDVMCHPERLDQPIRWKKPRRIFVNSMSDLFHEDVPTEFIDKVFAVMGNVYCMMDNPHVFQILTKRPDRMMKYLNDEETACRVTSAMKAMNLPDEHSGSTWPLPNVWIGVTVENQSAADERIPLLLKTPAAIRWVSCEPLLGAVDISQYMPKNGYYMTYCEHCGWIGSSHLCGTEGDDVFCPSCSQSVGADANGIDWVVAGGESGHQARPMHPHWALRLRDQCAAARVPFLFKQWGEWVPRSDIYHTFKDGTSCASIDPSCEKWKCIRLTLGGLDGNDLSNQPSGGEEVYMQRVGSKLAGNLLFGEKIEQFPGESVAWRNISFPVSKEGKSARLSKKFL